jgi:hypothetical protein
MNDEKQTLGESAREPVVVHPGPLSFDALLRCVDPAPDDEIERFVAAIYADRREASAIPPPRWLES